MKAKIGDKIYDSEIEPILLILCESEKELISQMGEQTKYCSYPESMEVKEIVEFMKI